MNGYSSRPHAGRLHSTKLDDLARLVRKAQYVTQVGQSKEGELIRLQLSNEILLRLSWTMRDSYVGLAELTRGDSGMVKRDFIDIYGRTMEEADLVFEHIELTNYQKSSGFARHLSRDSTAGILLFLQKLREEHDWVGERLSRLSSTGFENLLPTSEASTKQPSSLRESTSGRGDVHELQRTDALFTLICAIFSPLGNFPSEDDARIRLSSTILLRLVRENKVSSKADKFCLSMMDAWSNLYGWGALKHFEILLLDILQSGSKILERLQARQLASQSQNRAYYFSHQQKDDVEEEFFTDAARKVFQLLDDDELEGLPAGALRMAQAVLQKVDDEDARHYEAFITINWFFYRFLSRAITFPEQLGILNDYHITDAKRQRILFTLRQKVYAYCVPSSQNLSPMRKRSTIEEEIEAHVVSIYSKFRGSNGRRDNEDLKLLESEGYLSRSLNVPNSETSDAIPSFQVCPVTLTRMYSILCTDSFLESSGKGLSRQHSSSSTGSEETLNFKASKSPAAVFSVGSFSQSENRIEQSPTPGRMSLHLRQSSLNFEGVRRIGSQDGIEHSTIMFEALQELETIVQNKSALAESWQKVYVDKHCLSFEFENDAGEVETQEADPVRTAILQLVKQFQLPILTNEFNAFQNPVCRTPLHTVAGFFEHVTTGSARESKLLRMILRAGQTCFSKRDYAAADTYYKAYNLLQKKLGSQEAMEDYSPFLHGICNEQEEIIEYQEKLSQRKDVLIAHAIDQKVALMRIVDEQILQLGKLRLRMWYLCDVRKSKAWERSWEVVKCLNKMKPASQQSTGQRRNPNGTDSSTQYQYPPSATGLIRTTSRDRRFARTPRNTVQTQESSGSSIVDQKVFEALVGWGDFVCHNKLGSEQTRQTAEWMREAEIHNFCPAEERLQRLCYEVDDLTRYFLRIDFGHLGTLEIEEAVASKIWKFDLYSYERLVFKINGWNRDKYRAELDHSQAEDSSFTGLLRRGSAGDLLNLARSGGRARGNSVGSLDNPRARSVNRNASGVSSRAEIYAELKLQSSPVRSIDTSRRSIVPSVDFFTSDVPKQYDEQAIKDFLLRTQVGLTSLMLSDFSDVLFCSGSETDDWYNDDLTEAALARAGQKPTCLPIRTDPEERHPGSSSICPAPVKETAMSRPKHSRSKSSSMSQFFGGSLYLSGDLKAALVPPSVDIGGTRDKSGVALERVGSTGSYLDVPGGSDTFTGPPTPMRSVNSYTAQPQQFPLQKACREIMHRFSVQVSPYEKLRALYEFELLVVSNLTLQSNNAEASHHRLAPTMPVTPVAQQLKSSQTTSPATSRIHLQRDSVDLARVRVDELSIRSVPTTPLRSSIHTTSSQGSETSTPGADTIVDEIQRLLGIADIRPRTLFRDLQYIATFIPASILNMTDEGKVFWDFSLAALALKREGLEVLVSQASESLKLLQTPMPPPPATNVHWHNPTQSLADVITTYTYAAKEQHPTGMRELGLLMLEKPQACSIVVPPFSDPAIIFDRRKVAAYQGTNSFETAMKRLAAEAWIERAATAGDSMAHAWLRESASIRA